MQIEDHDILLKMAGKVDEIHREVITGNGGPSLKERVSSLEDTRSSARGWLGGAGAAMTAVWGLLEYLFHHGGGSK